MDGHMAYEKKHLKTLRAEAPGCVVLLKKRGDFPFRVLRAPAPAGL